MRMAKKKKGAGLLSTILVLAVFALAVVGIVMLTGDGLTVTISSNMLDETLYTDAQSGFDTIFKGVSSDFADGADIAVIEASAALISAFALVAVGAVFAIFALVARLVARKSFGFLELLGSLVLIVGGVMVLFTKDFLGLDTYEVQSDILSLTFGLGWGMILFSVCSLLSGAVLAVTGISAALKR